MRKELIILSGFLGSGKTTLLRSLLLWHSNRKVAVLLNDFGDIPVDGETLRRSGVEGGVVVEIGGGSVFCSCLREPFIKALANLAARDEDLIIVEASGMSDPSAVDKMLRLSGLDGLFEHTSTICLFDPVKSLKLARVLEVIPRQLASASVVVLTKADITTTEEREAARAYIRSLEPDLPIVESHNGNADFASLPERALRLFPVGFNTPETRPDCFALEAVRTDAKTLLDALTADGNVLRVKGYIRAADGVRFVSDTGQGFETMESRDAPMPLMIICMQGTAGAVRAALHAAGIA